MTERRLPLFRRRVGLSSHYSGGPPLTQVNGTNIQSSKRQKVKTSSLTMRGNQDPSFDPITAPPESSGDEAENSHTENVVPNDSDDSDEEYDRRRTADIRATSFDTATSSTDNSSSLAGSKRSAEDSRPKELDRALYAPLLKRKKQPLTKYGAQQKIQGQNTSQPKLSAPQDSAQPLSARKSFQRVNSISPIKSRSPRKSFKIGTQSPDFDDELGTPKPNFKKFARNDSSPFPTPGKRQLRHTSPVDELAEDGQPEPTNTISKGPRNRTQVNRLSRKRNLKGRKASPSPIAEEATQRPIFKMPGLEDIDPFDDSGSQDATTTQDTTWDFLEVEEIGNNSTPTCPMCHQEVDRELLLKYSTGGKMSVKQQTAFCRLHKRQSAAKAGTEKGYPKIDWGTMESRCRVHHDFLRSILEGTKVSHYRKVLKERVDSGKNRTLLTNHDNLTPGYYGPRGLQVMTEYIMGTLSDVIRRRAVEDKLISARSYTGFVQTVLVPELTVRLIMEDLSVTEETAREVLEESTEIGELLHEEAGDVVRIDEKEEDKLLES